MWWQILIGVGIGWFTCLSGVVAGGFLVFKTKREPYESLFKTEGAEGDVIEDDEFSGMTGEDLAKQYTEQKPYENQVLEKAREKFETAFKEQKVGEVADAAVEAERGQDG